MKFLLISKEYPPLPDASGSIVYHLAESLKKQGHCVDVIARDYFQHIDKEKDGDICWIKISYWEKLSKKVRNGKNSIFSIMQYRFLAVIRKFILMLFIKQFPDSEWWITKRTIKAYKKHFSGRNYDCIIGFFRPYSCLSAAIKIAENELDATCIACFFDIVDLQQRPSFMPKRLYEKLLFKGDQRVLEKCDRIMLPVSALKRKDILLNQAPNPVYYEFPTFIIPQNCNDIHINTDEDVIKLVFAGTMDLSYRNPRGVLEILTEVAHRLPHKKLQLDLFGGGNCEEIIRSFANVKNLHIKYHGQVPKKEVKIYEQKTDVLINIMNAYNGIVPSKIFELFASCKPILNFITAGDDGSLEYFEKYPLCETLKWDSNNETINLQSVEKAKMFLLNIKGKSADIELIRELYIRCTPEYVTEQIMRVVEEEKVNENKNFKNPVG